jgi:hypothetical protein
MKDRVNEAVETARPYVERIAHDQKLHENVKSAYDAARKVYDEIIGPVGATGIAMRVAQDEDVKRELMRAVEELREAGRRVRGEESHTARNTLLLLTGIALGILFNPMTGPETRSWLKSKVFGDEEPFEFQSANQSSNQS